MRSALDYISKHGPVYGSTLAKDLGKSHIKAVNDLIAAGLIHRRKQGNHAHSFSATAKGISEWRLVMHDTLALERKINSAMQANTYDGSELRAFSGRPGAMDAFDCPSMVNGVRVWNNHRGI
jgi:hypothetical protein